MKNLITLSEVFEQFGHVPLFLNLYANKYFVFCGVLKDIDISLMIHTSIVYEIRPEQQQMVGQFKDLIANKRFSSLIKLRVTKNLIETIFWN